MKSKLSEIEENIKDILTSAATTETNDEEIIKLKEDLEYYREQLKFKVIFKYFPFTSQYLLLYHPKATDKHVFWGLKNFTLKVKWKFSC